MGKSCHDDLFDAFFSELTTNADKMVLLSAASALYADTQADVDDAGDRLAEVAITSANYTGPSDGVTSGRKLIVNAQSAISVTGNETTGATNMTHIALIDTVASAILYMTTCTAQSLTFGSTANVPAFTIELRDPA
jgi:hypothetical protein